MKHHLNNLVTRVKKHYIQTYSQTIGLLKNIFTHFQSVTCTQHAPPAPDQPIKASTTYWLVRSSLRLTTNSRKALCN